MKYPSKDENKLHEFLDKLIFFVENKELIKLHLSNRRDKNSDLKSIIVSIVKLKKGFFLNFIYRYKTNDITKNYIEKEGIELIKKSLDNDFFNANLYSTSQNMTLQIKPDGKIFLQTNTPIVDKLPTFNHDKSKDRLINTENNIYLRELDIVNVNGDIRREMSDKYIQINQYIELIKPYLSDKLLFSNCQITDMGSGKGYLTFALYDYITNTLRKNIRMTGVEVRADLVNICNSIAKKSNFDNLNFVQGTIKNTEFSNIDVLIALHACDTATDDAIFRGIVSNSSLIVCAPCCHKQIRKEFNATSPLNNITKYGILKERQAEIITDSIRALLMEAFGYRTKVFEFISTEHTPKNVMIAGEKTSKINHQKKQQIFEQILSIKKIFGIREHYLEKLLGTSKNPI